MTKQCAVVFIHGLAKKPAPDKLKEIWLWGLSRDNPRPEIFAPPNRGLNLVNKGIPSFFNYYADVFYGTNYEVGFDSYREHTEELEVFAIEGLDSIENEIVLPQPVTPREHVFLRSFELALSTGTLLASPEIFSSAVGEKQRRELEIASFLPAGIKQAVIKKAAMEAYYFLFDKEYERADGVRFKVRGELRKRCLGELEKARLDREKIVVVAHSMGTMVAYDVLRNCPECPPVDTLITLGSPLGIREVQDELVAIDASAGRVDFPAARLNRWINVYDPLDPIAAADPRLGNDYRSIDGKKVEDIKESNWGAWRHTITHYFAGLQFRRALADAIGVE